MDAMPAQDPSAVLERLTRLERANRRWRRGTLLARPRLRIGLDQGGPGIDLLDERGGKRASLGFFDGEPGLVLYDGGLRVRAVVSVAQDRPTVILLDENRRQVFHAP